MASSSSFFSSPRPTPTTATFSPIDTSFFPRTTQLSITKKLKKPNYSAAGKTVSCKATKNGSQQDPTPSQKNGDHSTLNRFDRRDVLIGLGGLYGATNLAGGDPFALAAPISAPDITKCHDATAKKPGQNDVTKPVKCCPPTSVRIIDFRPPPVYGLRYRPAAHAVTPEYLAKFTTAMYLMKSLPDDDPRSFKAQADVHCAYCNGAYDQVGFGDLDLQVHNSWLFFPFHRLYLYFYERILGMLIGDPDFAMPFWNWDSPAGMSIPAIYAADNSPLYDSKRNQTHLPLKLVDLNYDGTEKGKSDKDQISANLTWMYKQMVGNSKTASMFFGKPYSAGSDPEPGMGSIETSPHIPIHRWVGDPREDYGEDMGNFYSAGKDPLFYAHHCNVDRMWTIWKNLPGSKRTEFNNPDWLDASFLFYDENRNLVRCKVRDCLDTRVLGYDYQPVDIPWLKRKPAPKGYGKPGHPAGRPGRPGPPRRPGPQGGPGPGGPPPLGPPPPQWGPPGGPPPPQWGPPGGPPPPQWGPPRGPPPPQWGPPRGPPPPQWGPPGGPPPPGPPPPRMWAPSGGSGPGGPPPLWGPHQHGHALAAEISANVDRNAFPLVLDKIVRIEVPRPKKSRSKSEKDDEEEVLVIENIQLNREDDVHFDVYVNDEDDEMPTGPEDSEFAGSFINLPHNHKHGKQMNTSITLGLTDLMEDLDCDDDDAIVVTLVPKGGKGLVTIGNVKIDYLNE